MGIYEELGVPRIINAMGTYTIYGGSKMSSQTLQDMEDAASSFIDLNLLQKQAGEAIAGLTHNEAAYVCNGAAAGVYLGLLAAVAAHRGKKNTISDQTGLSGKRDPSLPLPPKPL